MPAMLPLILGAGVVVSIAKRVIVGLGLGVIVFTGLSGVIGTIEAAMYATLNVPGDAQVVICLLRLADCISIIVSGVTVRIAMIPAKRFGLL